MECERKDWSGRLGRKARYGPIASMLAVRLREIVTAWASSLAGARVDQHIMS
jgi:hypothetical protein